MQEHKPPLRQLSPIDQFKLETEIKVLETLLMALELAEVHPRQVPGVCLAIATIRGLISIKYKDSAIKRLTLGKKTTTVKAPK